MRRKRSALTTALVRARRADQYGSIVRRFRRRRLYNYFRRDLPYRRKKARVRMHRRTLSSWGARSAAQRAVLIQLFTRIAEEVSRRS